jgi:hypothetical protein
MIADLEDFKSLITIILSKYGNMSLLELLNVLNNTCKKCGGKGFIIKQVTKSEWCTYEEAVESARWNNSFTPDRYKVDRIISEKVTCDLCGKK